VIALGSVTPNADGTLLAYITDESGRPQPWLRLLDGSDAPRRLAVDGAAARCAWRPDGSRLLVQTDLDGMENYRLAEVDPASGAVEWIAAEPGVRYEVGVPYTTGSDPYSRDGRFLAYASNARDRTTFDVHVRDLASGATRTVLRTGEQVPDDRYLPMFFSADGRHLLVHRLHQNTEHDLYTVDLDTGTVTHVTPHDGPAKFLPAAWTADGLYLCTTAGRDHTGLALRHPDGSLRWLHTPNHDIEGAAVSADGRRLVWGVNVDGYTHLYRMDLPDGPPVPVIGLPHGVVVQEFGFDGHALRLTGDGRYLAVKVATATAPPEGWVADLDAGTARQVTACGAGQPDPVRRVGGPRPPTPFRLEPDASAEPTTVHFHSADGLNVDGLLFRPPAASAQTPAPAVLIIHGGPEAQARPSWDPLVQMLVARGFGVLAPNIRGSSGRGLRYQRLIYRDWGGGDLADLAAAASYLRNLDWVDGDRLGVFGASYGGFAALSCLSRLPDRWRAGVSMSGPVDLVMDIRTYPPTWKRRATDWVGDPDDPADAAMLTERSPLTHVDRILAPLLLIHGENDTNVAIEGADLLHKRLLELGRTVRFHRTAGEGHGTADRAGRHSEYNLIVEWFAEHLR
jgi:dipeptidyl aminopeptidase/acylaminoacyl peptidase